jgi:hypothetical protein
MCLAACPRPADATPVLTWLAPWGADPRTETTPFGAAAAAAFGYNATTNGQVTDTGAAGDTGPAGAFLRATSLAYIQYVNLGGVGDASATVTFWRSFVLPAESPLWRVTLEGDLVGGLVALSSSGVARISAGARIIAGSFNSFSLVTPPPLLAVDPATLNGASDDRVDVNIVELTSLVLPSGTYTVQGLLSARANLEGSLGLDAVRSDFGGLNVITTDEILSLFLPSRRGFGFEVDVDAVPEPPLDGGGGDFETGEPGQPTPEPPTVLLIGPGLWAIVRLLSVDVKSGHVAVFGTSLRRDVRKNC